MVHGSQTFHAPAERLVLFGGTGFFGRAIAAEARTRGIPVRVVSRGRARGPGRRPSRDSVLSPLPDRIVDVTKSETLNGTIRAGDTVINLVGLSPLKRPPGGRRSYYRVHTQGTANVLREAVRAGARRMIYLSALGVSRQCGAAYGETKAMAEDRVRRAPISTTIIAPSILYGPGSEIVAMLGLLARLPLVPMPTLAAPFRPIHVHDAARLVVDAAVSSKETDYIPLVGPERLTATEVAATFLRARGTAMLPVPATLSQLVVGLASRVKLPGAPADVAPMLAIDNAGRAPWEAERLHRYTRWVSMPGREASPPEL